MNEQHCILPFSKVILSILSRNTQNLPDFQLHKITQSKPEVNYDVSSFIGWSENSTVLRYHSFLSEITNKNI